MKILHVETGMHLYGGAQQVAYLLDGLALRGIENVLVCPPGAAIGAKFRGTGVKVVEVACGGDVDLGFIFRLKRVIERERPQLVHLHSRRGADVLGGLAARLAGVPAVLSRRVDNPEAGWWARLKYRQYARVICISEGIAAVLRAEGVDAARIRVVRSVVDAPAWTSPAPRAEFLAEFGLPANRPVTGVVAQLIERKGHRVLFEALARLAPGRRPLLICFGQGPQRDALEAEAARLGLTDDVRFAGFRTDLPRWLGCLDLLVHPAYMEGLGVSLLQAAAAGVPIIASRAGGMPEAVRDGENGLLVPPGDVGALQAALERVLGDDALRLQLARGGPALIAREFSMDAMVEGNLTVYREVLGTRTLSESPTSLP
ncbi:glycosyltransferase [Fontimonas sp. SYSU GA230001]|uniref:glycosyltransferase n=1 Tax=Fontimonas sp. SYSU GA230001 TaxID=3142450 RepID=UPI0032B47C65